MATEQLLHCSRHTLQQPVRLHHLQVESCNISQDKLSLR
jgi:hypothetical protein